MKINTVTKANKDQGKCGKCRVELPAGSAYRWVKGRYSARKVRCTKSGCAFRPSDLTESKMSAVYAAQEELSDFISTWDHATGSVSDVQSACDTAAEAIREVAQEYADAAEAMQGAGEAMQEKSDNLENWAGEIEDAGNQHDEFETENEEKMDCPECMSSEERAETAESDTAEHQGEGKYECSVCGHKFAEEAVNGDGLTRADWAGEVCSTVEDVVNNCPE